MCPKFLLALLLFVPTSPTVGFNFSVIGDGLLTGALRVGHFLRDHSLCKLSECCTEHYIPADFHKLEFLLKQHVFGQHLAVETVVDALRSHWNSRHARKALTLSFHGRPGTGKNYVSKFIKDSLYREGAKSRFVHHFNARSHFPSAEKVGLYQEELYAWIRGNVTDCPYQLFVFDEVDKMPPGLLDVIKPVIDYNENVDKIDYRKSVFVFLSNTGGTAVMDQVLRLWGEGRRREGITLADFDSILSTDAFNEKGGFHRAAAISSSLIDHYIPFMPMQLEQVTGCVREEFRTRGVREPKHVHIDEVLKYINWGPERNPIFANTGCKRLSQLVAVIVEREYPKHKEL